MPTFHMADDDLEAYSLGRLSATLSVPLEEHLLVCVRCQDRLARCDEYTQAMCAACRVFHPLPRVRTAGGCLPE